MGIKLTEETRKRGFVLFHMAIQTLPCFNININFFSIFTTTTTSIFLAYCFFSFFFSFFFWHLSFFLENQRTLLNSMMHGIYFQLYFHLYYCYEYLTLTLTLYLTLTFFSFLPLSGSIGPTEELSSTIINVARSIRRLKEQLRRPITEFEWTNKLFSWPTHLRKVVRPYSQTRGTTSSNINMSFLFLGKTNIFITIE